MKALKMCNYKVFVGLLIRRNRYYWAATGKDIEMGVNDLGFCSRGDFKTSKATENNWKKFAKLNEIKNWEYV